MTHIPSVLKDRQSNLVYRLRCGVIGDDVEVCKTMVAAADEIELLRGEKQRLIDQIQAINDKLPKLSDLIGVCKDNPIDVVGGWDSLAKLTQESQDMGLYDPPFTNPMIKATDTSKE